MSECSLCKTIPNTKVEYLGDSDLIVYSDAGFKRGYYLAKVRQMNATKIEHCPACGRKLAEGV